MESRNGVRKQNLLGSENLCWGLTRLLLDEERSGRHGKNRKREGVGRVLFSIVCRE